jgi:hypothetical protein
VIEVRGLTKRYDANLLVDSLSFTVRPATIATAAILLRLRNVERGKGGAQLSGVRFGACGFSS